MGAAGWRADGSGVEAVGVVRRRGLAAVAGVLIGCLPVAGPVRVVSDGPRPHAGGGAVHRAESGARRSGAACVAVAVVERGGARQGSRRRAGGRGRTARGGGEQLAAVSRGRRGRGTSGAAASPSSDGPAAGRSGLHRPTGDPPGSPPSSPQTRPQAQTEEIRRDKLCVTGTQIGPGHSSEIRKTFPAKKPAIEYERELIERYRRMHGQNTLPGNKTNR
jgi:hypothetical protein